MLAVLLGIGLMYAAGRQGDARTSVALGAAVPDFQLKELRKFADELGIKAGLLINGSRTVITGVSVGPPLFDLLESLGQDTVVARLANALAFGKR